MGQSRCVGVVQAMVGSIGTSRDLAYTVSPSHTHISPHPGSQGRHGHRP